MSTDFTDEERVDRGARMHHFLSDPLVTEAFEKVKAAVIESWQNANTPQQREALHAKLTGLSEIRRELQTVVEQREYAKAAATRKLARQ